MPSLKTYIDSPLFYNGAELSATDMNILRNNAEAIKTASLRSLHVHNIHRAINTTNHNEWTWRGGFQYRTGLTTARFVIWTKDVTGQGDMDIVIYFNGVEVDRYDSSITGVNVGGFTTRDITLTGRGYADYEIITVEVKPVMDVFDRDAQPSMGEQYVFDAYTFPWSSVGGVTWPGVPSFGSLNASNLNQLANGLDYLAVRVGQMPYPLQMNIFKWKNMNNPRYTKMRWFRVKPANQNGWFNTRIFYMAENNNAEIRLTIGSVTWTYGPYSKGQRVDININVDLIAAGLSWNTDYLGTVEEYIPPANREDSSDGRGGYVDSRISIYSLATGNPNGYTMPATPATSQILESMTFSALQTRLNAIGNVVSTAYSNITGNPMVYDRGYMFRARYGQHAEQDEYWDTTFVAGKTRAGDVLWVKGKDVRLGYGPITTELKDKDKVNGPWTLKFQYEEQLLESDKVTQSYVYLDQYKGLFPGMPYYVFGTDIHYAAEHLR